MRLRWIWNGLIGKEKLDGNVSGPRSSGLLANDRRQDGNLKLRR